MILTDVSDTIHSDSLALFALNIEILLADVTKPEKSKILTLTWPVTSSVTSRSNVLLCTGSSRTGLSNGVWNFEIGPVVWEISGGPFAPPPPAGRVTNQTPAGRGLKIWGLNLCTNLVRILFTISKKKLITRFLPFWFYTWLYGKIEHGSKLYDRSKYLISAYGTADSKSGNRLALSDPVSYRRHCAVGFSSHF